MLITPRVCAIVSPHDRLMAKPGVLWLLLQTRWGPNGFPSEFKNCFTTPPNLSILSFSADTCNLWSLDSCVASHRLNLSHVYSTARESPTFAQISLLWCKIAIQAVVPLKLYASSDFVYSSDSCFTNAACELSIKSLSWSFDVKSIFRSLNILFMYSMTKLAAVAPFLPWPSKTPNKVCFCDCGCLRLLENYECL